MLKSKLISPFSKYDSLSHDSYALPSERIELSAFGLRDQRSSTELRRRCILVSFDFIDFKSFVNYV